MTVSCIDELVSEDWNLFLVVRWTVLGEWMTSNWMELANLVQKGHHCFTNRFELVGAIVSICWTFFL